ncbi:flagellar hook-basal body complex protein FliE [Chimaeribacter arupi]|uniref:Flagellar hook-basal body complex protein FliE n=2 Tax=Yersiniaceae TaxID=1903411 RepID=A0A2N5ELQ6_9GAMM|nr:MULTISPECIES: flagellar hook-basal body complex protein FliE [Yersiniaceae]MBS0967428.1 flagellar hook-basal body complex protein FliE [Nissabacter archeti]MDV5141520.1 flagellar hook-basal body complex protein FliE [Chimaeribacter arupi]PLR34575.1 flagellar hook-basal body complex protein FliE [Chimaeribacter arupi]PLR46543.1 flagellar hook-basal body complex protein FliE [Chimaeribacter arupi]PLR47289.1 flagellar hook-basal body complex protein FliE [Chimaeribacter arupi]
MSIQGIQSVLQQMQATALQAAGPAPAQPLAHAGFASELKAAVGKISDIQNSARTQAEKFELGVPGVGLNDVMVDLQKSSVSLQLGVQVRNKLVSAYQEIMNMQV